MESHHQDLVQRAQGLDPIRTAVVHPVDTVSLQGAVEAAKQNLIVPILIGPEAKIRSAAAQAQVDLPPYELMATEHSHAAAARAVVLARERKVEALMKGSLHTELGGGLMKGKFMLQGWKNMHPERHYFQDQLDLYEHIDDPGYIAKEEAFNSWYENPIDLPGRWYLEVITQLFKENRLARGEFIGLGRKLDLRNITCPTYLLAGADDDITTPEQVLDAAKYLGTPNDRIVQQTVPGGHIGLFMGARTLKEHWPPIAHWIASQ